MALAWLTVLGISVALLFLATASQISGESPATDAASELQSKVAVLLDDPAAEAETRSQLLQGPPQARLRAVTLAAELDGPEVAREELESIAADLPPEWIPASATLARLYAGDEDEWLATADSLPPEERAALIETLGWNGRLALAPPNADTAAREEIESSSQRTMLLLFLVGGGALGGCGFGLLAFAYLAVSVASGRSRLALTLPEGIGAPLIETFAIWLAAFVLLQKGVKLVELPGPPLVGGGAVMLVSLLALGWLRVRGVSAAKLRRDLGLHVGAGWLREIGAGLVGYVAMLPLLGVGVLLTLALTGVIRAFTGAEPGGAHPVMAGIGDADALELASIYVIAAVVAPLVEETTFRGMLYLHLRQVTRGWGRALSVLSAGLASGLVFAIVHPQGVAAVPVLAMMGCAFCLVREWRGSLVAPMVMHGVSNALMLTLASRLFG